MARRKRAPGHPLEPDFPDSATTLEVGDFYSGFVDWTRPVRLGGVQIGRNYGLQPYRVLTPTPSFLGQAVVPSTVELYVDGLRQYSGQVPVGPFQLAAQPGISGTGNAQVVVTDAFGRMQTLDFSFYGTQQLLAKGLSDWSVGVGQLREDFGQRSFGYDDRSVASASWRGGISDAFTGEAHAEGGGGLAQAGIGGWWLLGAAGVFNAAYARSDYHGLRAGNGRWATAGTTAASTSICAACAATATTATGRTAGQPATEHQRAGHPRPGPAAAGHAQRKLPAPALPRRRRQPLRQPVLVAQLEPALVGLPVDEPEPDQSDDRSIYLSLTASLGNNRQASLSSQRNGDSQSWVADVTQPVPGDGSAGGVGWRAQLRHGEDGNGGLAEVGILNDTGRYSFGASRRGGLNYAYASASGSVVWMGGHTFATREVSDAFAVISTSGVGGVPVRLENRLIGVTDDRGLLLVSPLLSRQRNRVSIDTRTCPRTCVPTASRMGDPAPARRHPDCLRAALATVAEPDPAGNGRAAAGGGQRGAAARWPPATVGYDGLLYLEDVAAGSVLYVTTSRGPCRVKVPDPPRVVATGARPKPAPLQCIPEVAP